MGGEAGNGGAATAGSSGAAGEAGSTSLPEACDADAPSTCLGSASPQQRVCKDGFWITSTCENGLLCDGSDGLCKPLIAGCADLAAGDAFCENDTRRLCGPDLVSTIDQKCAGRCERGACVSAACGDGKLQTGEACDDGNTDAGDGCSPSCSWEPIEVKLGAAFGCALFEDGRLKCWGSNQSGQLGNGSYIPRGMNPGELGPTLPTTLRNVTSFALGYEHACAVSNNGLWCWGSNAHGQLASGSVPKAAPTPTRVTLDATPVAVTAGAYHTCALLEDGSVECWGRNSSGQLGRYDAVDDKQDYEPQAAGETLPPVPLDGKALALSAGGQSVCALVAPKAVKCWGGNSSGQLGNGSDLDIGKLATDSLPSEVNLGSNLLPVGVTMGWDHTCAWSAAGALKCWGNGYSGALGYENDSSLGASPGDLGTRLAAVPLSEQVTSAAAGRWTTCAVLASGGVECWGLGDSGQLGRPDLAISALGDDAGEMALLAPIDFGDDGKAKSVALGGAFGCVLLARGAIKCWGDNSFGQLGIGSTETPTEFGNALKETILD